MLAQYYPFICPTHTHVRERKISVISNTILCIYPFRCELIGCFCIIYFIRLKFSFCFVWNLQMKILFSLSQLTKSSWFVFCSFSMFQNKFPTFNIFNQRNFLLFFEIITNTQRQTNFLLLLLLLSS